MTYFARCKTCNNPRSFAVEQNRNDWAYAHESLKANRGHKVAVWEEEK